MNENRVMKTFKKFGLSVLKTYENIIKKTAIIAIDSIILSVTFVKSFI